MRTSADSTLGFGRNTVGGTRPTISARAQYATFTETAPYASSPAFAASRSPTSRCTITNMRWICGTPSSRSATSGVATLYGRFATRIHRSVPRMLGQSAVSASASITRTPAGSTTLRSTGTSPRSTSIAVTSAPVSTSASVSEPRPGTDLDHAIARPDLGEPRHATHGVRIDDEVLPESAARVQAVGGQQLGDVASAEGHQVMRTLMTPAATGAISTNCSSSRSMIALP